MPTVNKRINKRIEKDLQKVYKTGRFKVFFEDDNNLEEFQIEIKAPEDSLYKDSYYRLNFIIPNEYPFKSPSVAFSNKIFHPNIEFCSGSICLNTLNKNWSAIYDLLNIVDVMIPQLLINPNPNDPFNVEASKMFTSDMELYKFEVARCIENHSCRKAYEKKFYREGFDLKEEKEEHPYYYSNDKLKEKKHKANYETLDNTNTLKDIQNEADTKETESDGIRTPFLQMESSVGLFVMDGSRTPPVLQRSPNNGFRKVRSFTSFKKVAETEDYKSLTSSRSKIDMTSFSNSKHSHSVDYKLFNLDKKDDDYLFNLGFSTSKIDDLIQPFGKTKH